MWAALTRGEPWKGEFHNRRKNGEEYVEYATITPIRQPDGRAHPLRGDQGRHDRKAAPER